MKVELSHFGEDGHYEPLDSQDTASIEHLILWDCVVRSVRVFHPEAHSLDITLEAPNTSVRWSGIYEPGKVDLGFPLSKGDRLRVRAKNVGHDRVLVRIEMEVEKTLLPLTSL